MEANRSYEEKLQCYVQLPSLQEMATNSLVLAISMHFYIEYQSPKLSEFYTFKFIDSLKIPSSIRKRLRLGLDQIREEIGDFEIGLDFHLLSDVLRSHEIKRMDPKCYAFYPNCKIDHVKTAINMLSSDQFSETQKFLIMCRYCLEEQIATFDLNSIPRDVVEKVDFDSGPFAYYWICRLKNELHKIPRGTFNSVDAVMISLCNNQDVISFQYFWNRLSSDERISKVKSALISLIHLSTSWLIESKFRDVFLEMSRDQQISFVREIPEYMLTYVLQYRTSFNFPHSVYWVWHHTKDTITIKQFASVVSNILFQEYRKENVIRVLLGLWQTAPDHHRNFAFKTIRSRILRIFGPRPPVLCKQFGGIKFSWNEYKFCESFYKFLVIFFSRESADFRKATISKDIYFAVESDVRYLSEILDLCLPDANEQVEFKSRVVNSEGMKLCCQKMLGDFEFRKLSLKLEYYLPDVQSRQEFQRMLVEAFINEEDQTVCCSKVDLWNELKGFINEAYAEDAAQALQKIEQIFSKFFANCTDDYYFGNYTVEELYEFVRMAESTLVGEKLVALKQKCLEFVQSAFLNVHNNYRKILKRTTFFKIVPWCLNNDEDAILRFKNEILPIDVVFDAIFSKFMEYSMIGIDHEYFHQLDEFLKWYLVDEEQIKSYKLRKINRPEFVTQIRANLEQIDEVVEKFQVSRPDYFLEREGTVVDKYQVPVLHWFFDEDKVAVREFCSKNLN